VVPMADFASSLQAVAMFIKESGDKAGAILIGDEEKIKKIIHDEVLSGTFTEENTTIENIPEMALAFMAAFKCIRDGRGHIILKGNTSSNALMGAAKDKKSGLIIPGQFITHMRVFETPEGIKIMTDGGINPLSSKPDPDRARQQATEERYRRIRECIISYATRVMQLFGVENIVACRLGSSEGRVSLAEALRRKANILKFPWIGPANIIYKACVDKPWFLEYKEEIEVKGLGKLAIIRKDHGDEILIAATPKPNANFEDKKAFLGQAIIITQGLGIKEPKVALLDFTEKAADFMYVPSITDSTLTFVPL